MAAVIGALGQRLRVPFGVDLLWDPVATGAAFAREVFTGVHAGDLGLWVPDAAAALRLRLRLRLRRCRRPEDRKTNRASYRAASGQRKPTRNLVHTHSPTNAMTLPAQCDVRIAKPITEQDIHPREPDCSSAQMDGIRSCPATGTKVVSHNNLAPQTRRERLREQVLASSVIQSKSPNNTTSDVPGAIVL